MHRKNLRAGACLLVLSMLAACGGGGGGGGSSSDSASGGTGSSAASSASSSSSAGAVSSSSSSSVTLVTAGGTCPTITLSGTDAQTLTGASTPLQNTSASGTYGVRTYSAPVTISGLHNPSNYQAAPKLPTWQFATVDPTGGTLTSLECDVAPDLGWHTYKRSSGTASTITHSKIVVTGGRNATASHIYTVFNGEQLVAALADAGLAPKIVRVVGHIDLRWSSGNTVFKEYTSYLDQKYGGSIMIPSNTTLVGINDSAGNPARITGTSILIGGELANGAADAETGFKAWIAAGKDGDDYPTWTRNIIIRNIKLDTPWDVNPEDTGNAYADGMTISRAQNIWIDHLSISDGDTPDDLASDTRHDGALDIVRGSDYVTISNTFFGDHHKNTLVGNGDDGRAWSDQDRLHVTFTGLWWKGIASRHPLIRFGQLHTFNNLMEGTTGTPTYGQKFESGLDVRWGSSVLSEGVFHFFTGLKPKEVCGKLAGGKDGVGYRVKDAQFISDKDDNGKTWATSYSGPLDVTGALSAAGCTGEGLPTADIAWTVPYSYTALNANDARVNIEKYTGAGRIGMFATTGTARSIASGATSSTASSTSSTATSSGASSSAASSAAASSAAVPVCTAAFTCNTGVGAQVMSAGVTATGSDSYNAGTYTINGAGNVTASTSYQHYFKYMPLTGDFVMTARLMTQGGSSDGARAGLLATDSLSGSGNFAWTARYASTTEIRAAINANNKSAISGFSTSSLPVWVRIKRVGSAIYSSASTDGVTWTDKTNLSVTANTLYVGFAVSSGSTSSAVTATFDNFSVTGGGLP